MFGTQFFTVNMRYMCDVNTLYVWDGGKQQEFLKEILPNFILLVTSTDWVNHAIWFYRYYESLEQE